VNIADKQLASALGITELELEGMLIRREQFVKAAQESYGREDTYCNEGECRWAEGLGNTLRREIAALLLPNFAEKFEPRTAAGVAVKYADALIAELAK
jgi:hypothetical protein